MTTVARANRTAGLGRPAELEAVLREILRSLSLLMIDADLPMREFESIAKSAYVQAASALARRSRGTVNHSSVSAITGLSRAEVKAFIQFSEREKNRDTRSRARRVVDGWTSDQRFHASGIPRVLPIKGRGATFETLVRLYGADTPPRALLDRLVTLQLVRVLPKKKGTAARVSLIRTAPRRHVEYVLLDIATQMSRALAGRNPASNPTLRTERISVQDQRSIAVLEQIVAERTATFLSGLRSLTNLGGTNQTFLEVFVGTASSNQDPSLTNRETKNTHARQKKS